MALPVDYSISTNFQQRYANDPAGYVSTSPGLLDGEFANIQQSINSLVSGLNDIRESDGSLATGVVQAASLAPSFYDDLTAEFAAQTQADRAASENAASLATTSAGQAAQSEADAANSAGIASARASDAALSAAAAETSATQAGQAQADTAAALQGALTAEDGAEVAEQGANTALQGAISARNDAIIARNEAESFVAPASSHVADLNNPHQTTPDQVGRTQRVWNAEQIADKVVRTTERRPSTLIAFDGALDQYTHVTVDEVLGAGNGFIGPYPINFANIADGRILEFNAVPTTVGGEFIFVDPAIGGGGGGATVFTDLGDTPATISGGLFLRGTANGQALEYVASYTAAEIDAFQLADAQARDIITAAVNANTAAISAIDISGVNGDISVLQQQIADIQNDIQTLDNRVTNIEVGGVTGGTTLSPAQIAAVSQIAQISSLQSAWVL